MPKIFRVASLPFCQRVHFLDCNMPKIHTKDVEEIGNENSKKKKMFSIPESFGTALQFYMIHE